MSELFYSIDPWAAAWNFRLWNASWQGALAIALAWGIARWCTFLSPRVICWVWRLVCLKLLVSLVWLSPVLIPLLPTPAAIADVAPDAAIAPSPWNAQLEVPHVGQRVEVQPARPQPILSLGGMIALCWVIGVACSIALTTRQWNVARRLRSSAGAAEQRIEGLLRAEARLVRTRRLPQLLASSQINSPILVGVIWPAILLPTGAGQAFSEEELRLMLAHELAHFKRRDLAWNWLPTLVGWLFFFHPLVWLMKRSWSEAQEAACDALVLESHRDDSSQYGRLLLKLATEWPGDQRNSLVAAGVLGAYRDLERRFLAIARVRPRSFVQLAIAAAVLAIISLPGLIPWRLVAQEPAAKPVQVAVRDDKSQQPNEESKTPKAEITGTVITGTFQPDAPPEPETERKPPTEKHQRAAAEIEKLGGNVSKSMPAGVAVVLAQQWKGGDGDIERILDLDDVTIVAIEDCSRFSPNFLAPLKKLRAPARLQLIDPTDEQVAALRGWENIESISLFGNRLSNAALATVGTLPNLKSLMFGGQFAPGKPPESPITDAGLAPLANCHKLRRLSINGCPQLTGRMLGELDQLPDLEDVWLSQIPLGDEGLAAVATLAHVKWLNLSGQWITSEGYAQLKKMRQLDRLSLYQATFFDDDAATNLADLVRLRVLGINGAKLTDAGLAPIARLTNLHALDIGKGNFSNTGLAHIMNLAQLRRFSLEGNLTIDDAGLKNLAGMTRLKKLTLPSKPITDAGLRDLAVCKQLETLDLSNSSISGSGLVELTELQMLRHLDLSDSPVSDTQLSSLTEFPSLQELDLDYTRVTDKGLETLARLKHLVKLNLLGDKITDAGLDALAGLRTLRSLRLKSPDVTEGGLERLREKLPDLNINGMTLTVSFVSFADEAKVLELDDAPDSAAP